MNAQESKKITEYINYIKITEPTQMLKDISGNPPSKYVIGVIQDLEYFYELKKPVINLFLQYMLDLDDGHLNVNYMMHIAERVKVKKIDTAEEAFGFFKTMNRDTIRASADLYEYYPYMLSYMKKQKNTYNLKAEVLHEIVRYSRKQNQGFFIKWFTDKLVEYVAKYNVYDLESVKSLLQTFHEKYIVTMGK